MPLPLPDSSSPATTSAAHPPPGLNPIVRGTPWPLSPRVVIIVAEVMGAAGVACTVVGTVETIAAAAVVVVGR